MPDHRLEDIVAHIGERQPACGSTTVVAIDGPSGSGKSNLAERLAEATGAAVLHLEDLYPGWEGLAATPGLVRPALESIAVGAVGAVPRWDWIADRPADLLRVPPSSLLLLDGVGSGAAVIRPFLSLLLWLDAPVNVRKRRALSRDGETYAPFWDTWAAQERRHFAIEDTRRHADLVLRTDA